LCPSDEPEKGKGADFGWPGEKFVFYIGQGLIDNDIEVTYIGLRREENGLWSL
jgi:hypothetical protein